MDAPLGEHHLGNNLQRCALLRQLPPQNRHLREFCWKFWAVCCREVVMRVWWSCERSMRTYNQIPGVLCLSFLLPLLLLLRQLLQLLLYHSVIVVCTLIAVFVINCWDIWYRHFMAFSSPFSIPRSSSSSIHHYHQQFIIMVTNSSLSCQFIIIFQILEFSRRPVILEQNPHESHAFVTVLTHVKKMEPTWQKIHEPSAIPNYHKMVLLWYL